MKICIIGPGIMPIPPIGWGAVEILIWDIKTTLESIGYTVLIINTPNRNQIIQQVNTAAPDFIHIMYDEFIDIINMFNCKKIAITSHYGYIEQPHRYDNYYNVIFNAFINQNANIFALSEGIKNIYIKAGISPNKIFVVPNGVRTDLFRYSKECKLKDSSIYLAKIDFRKRQTFFQDIPNLYFVGNISDKNFRSRNYLGEWSKEYLYNNLTDYANLVLLSDGEAHPLVCMEAMISGLGLVISEASTANLDVSKEFIDVIPENKITNIGHIMSVIEKNRCKSISMRDEIKRYAIDSFSYENIINRYYIPSLNKVIQ